MTTTIQETINRLRELDRVTAPAPWVDTINEYDPELPCLLLDANGGQVAEGETGWDIFYSNLDNAVGLLAELRNALPALLAEIDRLTAENAKAWEDGYKTAAHTYYEGQSEPDDFIQDAHTHNPYKENNR